MQKYEVVKLAVDNDPIETSGSIYPVSHPCTPEDFYLQQRHCENVE
jgi:hypothetical protein